MAQSPSKQKEDPLVGQSAPGQSAGKQQTDAEQRPGVSGDSGSQAPGENSEGASAAAVESAKKAASVVGGAEGREGRHSVETK